MIREQRLEMSCSNENSRPRWEAESEILRGCGRRSRGRQDETYRSDPRDVQSWTWVLAWAHRTHTLSHTV